MRTSLSITLTAALLAAPLLTVGPAVAADEPTRITLTRWTDNADFRTGTLEGVKLTGGKLVLDRRAEMPSRAYVDPFGPSRDHGRYLARLEQPQ